MGVDWAQMFVFEVAPAELFIRGTLTFWFIYILMRVAGRRDVGSMGMANILLLVLIADAAQNAMSAEYTSISEGAVLVATLVFWSVFIDISCYCSPTLRAILEPGRICLVKDGVLQRQGMRREFITEHELMAELRLQGIDDVRQVKRAYIEPAGKVSVITFAGEARPKKKQ